MPEINLKYKRIVFSLICIPTIRDFHYCCRQNYVNIKIDFLSIFKHKSSIKYEQF